jgi:hypothetical protein
MPATARRWSRAGTPTACPSSWRSSASWGPSATRCQQAELRAACRDYAMKFVGIQRAEFERLGVFGQWDDAVPHARPDVRGSHRPGAGPVRAPRLPVPRQEAGLLVRARSDRAGRGRDRVRRQDLAVDLRALRGARLRRRHAGAGAGRQARGAADLDHDAVDAAGQPGDRRCTASCRTWRCPRPAGSGERPAGGARAGRRSSSPRSAPPVEPARVGRDRRRRARSAGDRRAVRPPVHRHAPRQRARRSACGSPTTSPPTQAPAWSTPRPATAPTTTAPAPSTTSTPTRPSTRAAATSTA